MTRYDEWPAMLPDVTELGYGQSADTPGFRLRGPFLSALGKWNGSPAIRGGSYASPGGSYTGLGPFQAFDPTEGSEPFYVLQYVGYCPRHQDCAAPGLYVTNSWPESRHPLSPSEITGRVHDMSADLKEFGAQHFKEAHRGS